MTADDIMTPDDITTPNDARPRAALPRIDRTAIEQEMLERIAALAEGKSLDPTELARSLGGADEKIWRLWMAPIRAVAIRLAESGHASILRKGRAVDPRDFKGVYRIGRPVSPPASS